MLGLMFSKGDLGEKDHAQASYWFLKAAQAGEKRAMYNLAIYYENGIYLTKDLDKAIYWYNKSYEMGFEKAKERLDVLMNEK